MVDRLTASARSSNMRRVGGKHTAPELKVRQIAHRLGLRFRLHRRDLPGSPDIVFPRSKLVVFVHGCFWHRHEGCSRASTPATRTDFWMTKFAKNVDRDRRQVAENIAMGWRVLVIWECELRSPGDVENRLAQAVQAGLGSSP